MKRILLSLVILLGMNFSVFPLANAETDVIQAQIVSSNTTWGTPGKALKIEGLVQIRTGVTLTIYPGTLLDVSGGSFLVLGNLSIIGNSTLQKPVALASSWLSGSGKISLSGLNISGSGGALLPYEVTGSISVVDSTISNFNFIFGQTQSSTLIFSGNTVVRVPNFYANPGFFISYSVSITNNSFYDIQRINGEWPGIFVRLGQVLPSYEFTGNYFENSSTVLSIEPRSVDSYPNLRVSNNHFATPGKVAVQASGVDFSQNYWSGITSVNQFRAQVKVSDGTTNITLPIIKFEPLLSSPPSSQPSFTRLKTLLEAEVTAKAAAELKAKQEAEAKVAAELKVKQESEVTAAAELKAKQEAEAKAAAAQKLAATKKTTVICSKGKLTKKVTGVKPKCPTGYKVRK